MKTIPLAIAFTLSMFLNYAQQAKEPVKDFNLQFSVTSIEIKRGESGRLDLTIQKSRQFMKGNVKLGTSSAPPKGIAITFEPSSGVINSSSVDISVATDAVPGTYSLILNGTINKKTKASIVKLIIP